MTPTDIGWKKGRAAAGAVDTGRKKGRVAARAVKTRKRPLLVICEMKAGPPPPSAEPPSPVSIFTAMPTRIGTAASTARRARVRQRRKVVSSSLRKRVARKVVRRLRAGCGLKTPASACDIEALPRQCHEGVLQ